MSDPTRDSAGSTPVPGSRRSYRQWPTGPVDVSQTQSGPDLDSDWTPADAPMPEDRTRLAPWALGASIIALAASMFVGWGIPVAIVAVVGAIMTLRRPMESRAIGLWALVLGIAATVFSAVWLVWAGLQWEQLG